MRSRSHNSLLVFVALLTGAMAGRARAQAGFEAAEAQTALKAALGQIKELEARLERERQAGEAMAARAAAASAEAKSLADEIAKLRTQAEVVGSAALGDSRALDRRLLDAVNDLRLAREENRKLSETVLRLSEAVIGYLRAPADRQATLRQSLEAALAEAANQPSETQAADENASRVETSQVVSAQPEHKLVVINAGEKAGLRIGTPIRFYRHDRPVASALIVDVREKISGALVTALPHPDDFPKVGDSLRIDTSKN
jgi:chromosome segregation ATPase